MDLLIRPAIFAVELSRMTTRQSGLPWLSLYPVSLPDEELGIRLSHRIFFFVHLRQHGTCFFLLLFQFFLQLSFSHLELRELDLALVDLIEQGHQSEQRKRGRGGQE